jgi:hypothetical protein
MAVTIARACTHSAGKTEAELRDTLVRAHQRAYRLYASILHASFGDPFLAPLPEPEPSAAAAGPTGGGVGGGDEEEEEVVRRYVAEANERYGVDEQMARTILGMCGGGGDRGDGGAPHCTQALELIQQQFDGRRAGGEGGEGGEASLGGGDRA